MSLEFLISRHVSRLVIPFQTSKTDSEIIIQCLKWTEVAQKTWASPRGDPSPPIIISFIAYIFHRLMYGYILSNTNVLSASETSFVLVAGLIPQDVERVFVFLCFHSLTEW